VLWRHGRTAWNAEGRFQGQIDVPLDEVGVGQAARAARLLANLPPALLVSSDLSRARDTALALAEATGLPLHEDERLRETYAGSWQGRLVHEIEAEDADGLRDWRRGADIRPGGGETRGELAERTVRGLRHWLDQTPPDGTLVAATHGGTARAALGKLLGLPLAAWPVLGGLANGAWSVLEEAQGGWRLAEHNAGTLPERVMSDDDT